MRESKPPILKLIKQLTRKRERKHLKALFAEQRKDELGIGIDWYAYRAKNGKDLEVLNHFLPGYLEQLSGGRCVLSFLALVLLRTRESLTVEARCREIIPILKKRYEESHSSGIRVTEIRQRTGLAERDTLEAL